MVDFSIKGVASLTDRVSPKLEEIRDELDKVQGDLRDTSANGEMLERTLDRMVPAGKLEGETEAVKQAIDEMVDSGDIASINEWRREIRKAGRSVSNQNNLLHVNQRSLEELSQEYTETAVQIAQFKEQVEDAVDTTTTAEAEALAQAIENVVDADEIGNLQFLQREFAAVGRSAGVSSKRIDDMEEELEELRNTTAGYTATAAGATATTNRLASSVDEAGDEAAETASLFEVLDQETTHLSADLGFFHISIGRLLVTLPKLAVLLGSVTKAIGGLALGASGAASAFIGLMGVGLLGWAEALDQQFASIEGTGEAMRVIFSALGSALRDALEPLMSAQLADGTSAMEFVLDVMGGLVDVVRTLAVGLKDIIALQEVDDFFDAMADGLLGASASAGGLASFMEALKTVTKQTLPIVTEIILMVGRKIPELMTNWGEASGTLSDHLIRFTAVLIEMMSVLSDVGITLMRAVLPPLTAFLAFVTELGRIFNSMPEEAKRVAISLLLFAAALQKVSKQVVWFYGLLKKTGSLNWYMALSAAIVMILEMTNALDDAKTVLKELIAVIPGVDGTLAENISQNTFALTAFIYAVIKATAGLVGLSSTLLGSQVAMNRFKAAANAAKIATLGLGKAAVWTGRVIKGRLLASSLAPLITYLGTATGYVMTFLGVFTSGGTIFNAVASALGAIASAVGITVAALVALIAVIAGLIVYLGYLTGDIEEALNQFPEVAGWFDALLNPIQSTKDALAGLMQWLDRAANNFNSFIKQAENADSPGGKIIGYLMVGLASIVKLFAMIGDVAGKVGAAITNTLGKWTNKFIEIVDKSNVLRGLFEFIFALIKVIVYIIAGLAAVLLSPLIILGLIITHWEEIKQWIGDVIEETKEWWNWLTDIEGRLEDIAGLWPDHAVISPVGSAAAQQQATVPARATGNQTNPQPTSRSRGQPGQAQPQPQNQTNVTVNVNGSTDQEEAGRIARQTAREVNQRQRESDGYN